MMMLLNSVVVVLVEDWFTWRRYMRCRIFAPTDINIASNKDQKLHLKQILQIGDEIWRKWDKDAISKPCQLFENTRSLVHNDRIVMHGVLSIYIFKRYQSSEILIKDKDHQRQGRESTDIPALLCGPSQIPPAYWNPSQKLRSKEVKQLPCPKESRQHPNFPSEIPSGELGYFETRKTSITTLGKRASCKLPLSSYTNERMERRIFFHNSWTINMHMFKILLPELLLKIDAFYL